MRITLAVTFSLSLAVAGCGVSPTSSTGPVSGHAIRGSVHGGQQPVGGTHVYLFAANSTGFGASSISLLGNVPGSTTLDASGGATTGDYYVTADSNGGFSITGDYTCLAGQQVYLYAQGGNPGSGNNSALSLLAILGDCQGSPSGLAYETPAVNMDEVTTIAAAFSFSGFATDPLHVSSSATALGQIGLANAFGNAANLASLSGGTALAATPAGNAVAPQQTVKTLANILAPCVNSTGPGSSACMSLFSNAENGSVAPTDTATAAINIAHNPGANIAALYALPNAAAPFTPTLTSQPNDFNLPLVFSGYGLADPVAVAIDGSGNAWIANGGTNNSVSVLSGTGEVLSGNSGYTGGGLNNPAGIAIDTAGNAWIANKTGASVTELTGYGTPMSGTTGYTGGGITSPVGVAIDGSGNAWIANSGTNSVTELSSAGAIRSGTSGYTGGGLSNPSSVAIDGSGNVWITNGTSGAFELSGSGGVLSGPNGYVKGGFPGITSMIRITSSSPPTGGVSSIPRGLRVSACSWTSKEP